MPRTLLSIFFLSVMTLFQFGRVMGYLHCKLDHIINNNTATCDCEKQVTDNPVNTSSNSQQKTFPKEKTAEDFFLICQAEDLHCFGLLHLQTKPLPGIANIPTGFNRPIFQPPRVG